MLIFVDFLLETFGSSFLDSSAFFVVSIGLEGSICLTGSTTGSGFLSGT